MMADVVENHKCYKDDDDDEEDELFETCDVWDLGLDNKMCTYPLHCATGNDNLHAVHELMIEGSDVNELDSSGNTALHIACIKRYYSIASALIEAGCEIDIANNRLATPLLLASQGDANIVQLLIDKGADVNAKDYDDNTPLHIACSNGNAEIVKLLVHSQCNLNVEDGDGHTPLHCAVIFGDCNPAVVQHLIDGGCDVNALDGEEGAPPLLYAVRAENPEVVNMLTGHGADVHSFDVLLWALEVKNPEIVEILLRCGIDLNDCDHRRTLPAIIEAVRSNATDMLKVLLKYNCDVNRADKEGNTALHFVSTLYTQEMAELLLSTGQCNINHINVLGETALHVACRTGCKEIVQLLIAYGSNLDLCDQEKRTPLHFAVHQRRSDVVRILIKANSSLQVPETPSLFFLYLQREINCFSPIRPPYYIDKTIPILLLEAGYNLSIDAELHPLDGWKTLVRESLHDCYIKKNQELFNTMKIYSQQPRTLQLLCAITIRKMLGRRLLLKADTLEIPQTLKNYLKFDYL